jgi:hypothetical protein
MAIHQKPLIAETQRSVPRRAAARRRGSLIVLCCVALLAFGCAFWAWLDPSVIPTVVDIARGIVGPGPVAQIEAWVFQAQDTARQTVYRTTGAQRQIEWAAPAATLTPRHASPPPTVSNATSRVTDSTPFATPTALPASDIWSPFMTTADGQPVLERALIAPDPDRPYAQAALVRIDLRQTLLHLVAGTHEPVSTLHVARPGRIPPAEYPQLLAAFNGGFKAVNGAFGMAVDGATLLPPRNDLATLALYRDESVRLGVWGRDMHLTPDMVAFRQNCPLLVDDGKVTALGDTDDPALWGNTVNHRVATWRSGLGLSANGRFLIYAAGDSLTVQTLAQALVMGGADRAMQLDINSYWTRFVTYTPSANGHAPIAQKLINSMVGNTRQFLAPDTRDFFDVTAER